MPDDKNKPERSVGYNIVIQNGAKDGAPAYILVEVWCDNGNMYKFTRWSVRQMISTH